MEAYSTGGGKKTFNRKLDRFQNQNLGCAMSTVMVVHSALHTKPRPPLWCPLLPPPSPLSAFLDSLPASIYKREVSEKVKLQTTNLTTSDRLMCGIIIPSIKNSTAINVDVWRNVQNGGRHQTARRAPLPLILFCQRAERCSLIFQTLISSAIFLSANRVGKKHNCQTRGRSFLARARCIFHTQLRSKWRHPDWRVSHKESTNRS